MTDEWDGKERREAVLADERTRANGATVEVPVTVVIVGFVAVVLLQLAALAGHALLSNHQDSEFREAREARQQIGCFVIGITQGKAGQELLTDCGFLNVGGN
jgi:hypothetical protein